MQRNVAARRAGERTKDDWRTWAKATRATLDITALTPALLANLRAVPEFTAARHVMLYLAMPGEVRVEDVIEEGKRWYVPRCAPGRRLAVHPWVAGATPLRAGPFGIREPDAERVEEVGAEVPEVVIVPGLVLGEDGRRVGYGGGYYDRFLPRTRPGCVRVGVMPSVLVVGAGELPVDLWDVPLDVVVTEVGIVRAGGR
jgi:5-formyltetrahydrofolate cyclo-ligase